MESIIKNLRIQNRYTQIHLAEILGISRQALIKYENLAQDPPVSIIRLIAKLFDVSYDCIIDNKLPDTKNEKDSVLLIQITKNFPLLREDEKVAVAEMIRIMANSKEKN